MKQKKSNTIYKLLLTILINNNRYFLLYAYMSFIIRMVYIWSIYMIYI